MLTISNYLEDFLFSFCFPQFFIWRSFLFCSISQEKSKINDNFIPVNIAIRNDIWRCCETENQRKTRRKICAILILPISPTPQRRRNPRVEAQERRKEQGSIFRGGRVESKEEEKFSFLSHTQQKTFSFFKVSAVDWSLRELNSHDMGRRLMDPMVAQILICLRHFSLLEANLDWFEGASEGKTRLNLFRKYFAVKTLIKNICLVNFEAQLAEG